jgi:hypothetical protein
MSLSETEDPIEMIRESGADPQVLGRIWDHYRDRLGRVVRLRDVFLQRGTWSCGTAGRRVPGPLQVRRKAHD